MKKFSFKSFIAGALTSAIILTPIISVASNTQSIDVIFGKIKLIVNGVEVKKDTLLYNGTTYLPVRAVGEALNAEVKYNAAKYEASITTNGSGDSANYTYWANKVYILATNADIDANKLIISNVTATSFNFEFKSNDKSIIKSTANITDYTALCNVSDIYGFKFEIHGDEITVSETGKAQLFPDSTATYVHKTDMKTESPSETTTADPYTNFKAGKYSSGSSDTAKTLVISNIDKGNSFKYQVIAANGKDIVTEGVAKILAECKAECVFDENYKITLTDLRNDVIELKESEQKLFAPNGIKFYTIN